MKQIPFKISVADQPYLQELLNDLLAQIRSQRPRGSLTTKVSETANGTIIDCISRSGSVSGVYGPYQIESVQDDYFTCYKYDFSNSVRSGTDPVYIAKEDQHQNSLTEKTIFGVTHSYTYAPGTSPPNGLSPADANNVFRIDSYSGTSENQRIIEPWTCGADGEFIWALRTETGVLGPGGLITLQITGRTAIWSVVDA